LICLFTPRASIQLSTLQCSSAHCSSASRLFYCCFSQRALDVDACAFGGAGACTQFENFDARAHFVLSARIFINTPHSVSGAAANSTDCISCEQIRGCCVRVVLFDAQNQIFIIIPVGCM
jgi:hypothetical protein